GRFPDPHRRHHSCHVRRRRHFDRPYRLLAGRQRPDVSEEPRPDRRLPAAVGAWRRRLLGRRQTRLTPRPDKLFKGRGTDPRPFLVAELSPLPRTVSGCDHLTITLGPPSTARTSLRLMSLASCARRAAGRTP